MLSTPRSDQAVVLAAPFPAGHVSDLHARLLAPHVSEALEQPVRVENWPGASGTAALGRLRDAKPDGNTVMMHGFGGLAVTPHLVPVDYDPTRDFTAVIKLATAPLVLVAHPELPVTSVPELIALSRDHADRVRGRSFGDGTNSHMALMLFNLRTGLRIPHTPHPGGYETTEDLVTSSSDIMFEFPPVVMSHIERGHLRALAVTTRRRSGALPDVPTLEEAGIHGVDIAGWQGIIGPRGISAAVVDRLNQAFAQVQAMPEITKTMETAGLQVETSGPHQFASFIIEEYERWGAFIREEGIRLAP